MLISLTGRFAYLAMTKTGSTSVENAIRPDCPIAFSGDHRVTHMPAHHFETWLRPYLAGCGFEPIDSVAQIRHPVDWLASWWRYRAGRGGPEDTAGQSLADFAAAFLDAQPRAHHGLWRPLAFFGPDGRAPVDILYRFEDMDLFARFLSGRLDRPVAIPWHNRSPGRAAGDLPAPLRARLEAFFAPEMEIWEGRTERTATPAGRPG